MTAAHIVICQHDFAQGGTERVAMTLASQWLDTGRRVTILCGSREGGTIGRADPRVEIVELSPPIRRSSFSRLALGEAMARRLPDLQPDAVFIPGNFHFGLGRPLRRALLGVPIVAKVSNPLLPALPWPVRPVAAAALRAYLAPFDALVFMADELAAAARGQLPDRAIAVIAEPSLPAGWQPPPRDGPQQPPLVIAIGRMERQKHLALALRSFAALRRQREARLLVLGDGPERSALEALAAELGISGSIEMPGYVPGVASHIARASALLLTSRYEGYPAVVVEALAGDCPVVATNCTPVLGGLLGSDIRGRIVDRDDPEALAQALAAVLDLPFTSAGARPDVVAHNDAPTSAAAWLALFDRLKG
jgi:glycosyltransferase involved in cell wall biosynthesis